MSEDVGKDVPLNLLKEQTVKAGLTDDEFSKALAELEEQGIIYQSKRGTVSYTDIEL